MALKIWKPEPEVGMASSRHEVRQGGEAVSIQGDEAAAAPAQARPIERWVPPKRFSSRSDAAETESVPTWFPPGSHLVPDQGVSPRELVPGNVSVPLRGTVLREPVQGAAKDLVPSDLVPDLVPDDRDETKVGEGGAIQWADGDGMTGPPSGSVGSGSVGSGSVGSAVAFAAFETPLKKSLNGLLENASARLLAQRGQRRPPGRVGRKYVAADTERREWIGLAKCRNEDPNQWVVSFDFGMYVAKHGRLPEENFQSDKQKLERAGRVCASCRARLACLREGEQMRDPLHLRAGRLNGWEPD